MNGYYNRICIYNKADPCWENCKNKNCPYYTEDDEEEYEEEDEEE